MTATAGFAVFGFLNFRTFFRSQNVQFEAVGFRGKWTDGSAEDATQLEKPFGSEWKSHSSIQIAYVRIRENTHSFCLLNSPAGFACWLFAWRSV